MSTNLVYRAVKYFLRKCYNGLFFLFCKINILLDLLLFIYCQVFFASKTRNILYEPHSLHISKTHIKEEKYKVPNSNSKKSQTTCLCLVLKIGSVSHIHRVWMDVLKFLEFYLPRKGSTVLKSLRIHGLGQWCQTYFVWWAENLQSRQLWGRTYCKE